MRVLHAYKDAWPPVAGGIERHIDLLRHGLAPEVRSDLLVAARRRRGEVVEHSCGAEIRAGELGRVWSVPLAPSYPLRLARARADVLHLHAPSPIGELSALLARPALPIVLSIHADIVRQASLLPAYRRVIGALIDRAAAVLVGSRGLLDSSPLLAGRRDRVQLVPYGIDTDYYEAASVRPDAVAALRRQYGAPLVITVGRLVYYKGFEQLAAAFTGLDASLVIVGSGPLEPRVRELAAANPRIHATGQLSDADLRTHLAAADVFALASTSRAESFGIATVEAQAMGLPAVVTDVGSGTLETIDPGRSGLAVPPGDPAALRRALTALLADPERRAAMSAAARRHAVEHFRADRMVAQVAAVYADVLRRR